jgi:hypothetical protein
MNTTHIALTGTFEDRLGMRIAARLADATQDLPHDVSERLKAARAQALMKRKIVKLETATSVSVSGGTAALNGDWGFQSIWGRLTLFFPLIALVAGLVSINVLQDNNRTDEIAEVDTELLTDELPPSAYTDPGFAQFLRVSKQD